MNEFIIKNGFISKGDSIVDGTISGDTLNLTTIPSNDNSQTQVLVRNNTSGLIEYRDASSLSGGSGTNTFVTGTTFGSNQSLTRRNDGADVLILTGGTNVTLSNPSTNQIKIDVNIPAGMNTFVTGFTYNDNNTFTIFDNDGGSFPATINQVSGLTVNGILSATTISGGTFYGDGSNLTGISTDDNYVTGGTFTASANTLTLDRQNGSVTITGLTSSDGTSNEIQITDNSGGFLASVIEQSGTHIIPTTDSVTNLGSATNRFDNLYLDTIVNVDGGLNFYSNDAGTNLEFTIGTGNVKVAAGNTFQIQNGYMYFTGTNDRIGSTVASKIYLTNRQSSLRTGNLGEGYGFVVGNGIETAITPDTTAIFKIQSTTQGFLPPVMTGVQVEGISTPTEGLQAYASNAGAGDVTSSGWWGYDGSNWVKGFSSGGTDTNTFVTGFTYNDNNTFTIFDNVGGSFPATINQVSGLTVNGILSASTYTGITLNSLDDVTTGIPATPDNTYQGRMVYFDVASNEWLSTEEYVSTGTVTIWGKKGSAGTIDKGLPVYIVGFDDDIHEVEIANSSTGTTMPVIGFTSESFDNTNTNPIVTFGKLTGINTSSGTTTLNPNGETWVINDELYISTTTGGLTKNRPAGTDTKIQRVAKILKVGTVDGQLFVFNTARTAGLPNLTTDYLWVGNGNDTPQEIIKTDVGITTTGFTYNDNNTFTIFDNAGDSFPATISQVSGLTVNGTLSATTLDGSILLSGGTNLLTIIESLDTYVTGGTVSVPATDNSNDGTIGLLYKNSEGVPHTLPFEDTYTSGTTFSSNQATLTRNDGTEVLKLTGGTNVTLSNPSTNEIKIDVSSSSSIDTGNVLWVDNIFGDDGTALVDRQDKPWSSIATALSNSVSNDTIMVRPGEYVEPDFTLIPGTSLISQGGAKVTFISASTNTGNFITVSGSSFMEGFTIYTPTDDSAALYFNDSTAGIVTSINDVHFKGVSTSTPPLGKGLIMDSGLASNGKIIYRELRYGGGNLNIISEINGGIFALDGMHVPGGGTVNKSIQMNGGRGQLINVNIGNPLCDTALSVSGTASNTPVVVGFGLNLFNVPTGLEITSNYYDIELQNGRVEAGTDNLLVTSGLTGEFGKLNMVNFIMDSEKIDEIYTWADSDHIIQFSDIGNAQNLSPIQRLHGNLEIGQPNRGSELSVGRGSEYQNGLHVHASGTTGDSNVILSAKTKGVSWTFESLTAGEQLYIGSDQRYSNGDYVNWSGFELTYTGSTGGTYTIEYYSGGTWVDISYQVTNSDLGYNYANNLFSRTVATQEDIRFGIGSAGTSDWDELSLFGHTAKWIRVTMVTPPSSLPQFDLLWLESSHTKINKNGIPTFYGSGLYLDTLVSAGNIFGESGGVVDASVPVGSGGLPTGWNHVIKNSKLNQNGDAIYLQAALPKGICTAYPISVTIYYGLDPADSSASFTTSPQLITSFLARGAAGTSVADPLGGIVPTPRTIQNTETLTSTAGLAVTSNLVETGLPTNTYAGKPLKLNDIKFNIADYYEGDGFLLRIELDNDGTPNNDVIIFAVEVDVVKWSLGERINIET